MRDRDRSKFITVVLLLAVIAGCNKPATQSSTAPQPRTLEEITTDDGSVVSDISSEEADQFAAQWQQAVEQNDSAAATELIDWTSIFDRALEGFDVDPRFRSGFHQGASQAVKNLVGVIHQSSRNGGSYRLVHSVQRGKTQHVVMRLLTDDGGTNYHDFQLARKNGKVVGEHFFIAMTGESFGDSLRTNVAAVIQSQNSVLSRLSGTAKAEMENLSKQQEMSTAVQQGDYQRALQIYEELPAKIQQMKLPMLFRVMSLAEGDYDVYVDAINAYSERFPNDACLGLITLDAAGIKEDEALLLKSYDSIQKWTGGDPYLTTLVAGVRATFGATDEAQKMLETVDVDALGLAGAHDFALTVSLASDDHESTLHHLAALRDQYGYEFSDLAAVEDFKRFAASPAYQQWLEGNTAGQ
ncbi:hypothetical protein Enr13x_17720 [Stieleria neptunia]|uniref:Uncharacterized protein n=1 Tax=Stieleria neptunia TaxID=2527979 RepID=A0A518HMA3_9BACT|nr:hypothetical protein [Stieleria neptunia]QDV41929.1 hypothetical protein Enr13x_17720 [Stieleria neptunia]